MSDELIATQDINSKEQLKVNVVSWAKVNKLIKEYEGTLKELKQQKLDLQKRNVEFMRVNDLDRIELDGGQQVNLVVTRSKLSNITKARMPAKLEEFFEKKKNYDSVKAAKSVQEIIEFLDSEPVFNESAYLRWYEP
jgi:hypothetical protein